MAEASSQNLLSPFRLVISAIVPVYNGGGNFRLCLSSVKHAVPPPDEIIVVADGDTDGSWCIAEEFEVKVLRIPTPEGPARARNLGGQTARGDILFFIDADVVIPQNAMEQISEAFRDDRELTALIGSYDDEPKATNFLSQYKNLFHHYTHQAASKEASTFWAACGAIRRDVFLAMGGFDENYHQPCIEDIELGYRLKEAGYRIRLSKELQVKHLKRWRIFSLLKSDFFYRALPWTELILSRRQMNNDLNLRVSNRLSVILIYIFHLALIGAWWWPGSLAVTMGAMLLLLGLNAPLYGFFWRKRGLRFAMKTIPWHWLYYFYSGLAFAIGVGRFFSRIIFKTPRPELMRRPCGTSHREA